MTLDELQRIKQWHVRHKADHPLEGMVWAFVTTLWVMAWVGWFPTYLFDQIWAVPLCCIGVLLPGLYVDWRASAHKRHKLRCDWLHVR